MPCTHAILIALGKKKLMLILQSPLIGMLGHFTSHEIAP